VGVLSPKRIVLGGGVMQQPELLSRVRRRVVELLAGYVRAPAIVQEIERYIVPPALGGRAGVIGALALAQETLTSAR
jgi:fructokinase